MGIKKRKLIRLCSCCFLAAIVLVPFSDSWAGVRGDMGGIPDLDSLGKFYEESNDYTRRYVLRELPNWLNKRRLPPDIPGWVEDVLDDALDSYRPLLIREAAVLIGRYSVDEYADRMAEIYKAAHRWFPAEADRVRCSIVQALLDIGGAQAETHIPELFMNSQRFLLSDEFAILMGAAAIYGNPSCIEELSRIEQHIIGLIGAIPGDPYQDPARMRSKYENVLQQVTLAKEKLIAKEGGDE